MSSITLKVVNPSLVQDLGDPLRTALGGYYSIAENEAGETSLEYSASNANNDGTKVLYTGNPFIKFSKTLHRSVVTASNKVIVPSYTIPVVLVGRDDNIKNDVHWNSIILGRTYDSASYDPIVRPTAIKDTSLTWNVPYELLSLKEVVSEDYGNYEYMTQGYKYNYFYPTYETTINEKSVYQIPNLYLLNAAFKESTTGLDDSVASFVNLEGEVAAESYDLTKLFTPEKFPYPAVAPSDIAKKIKNEYVDEQSNYKTYLDMYNNTIFSASTLGMAERFRNVIFDRDFVELDTNTNLYSVPYYADMSWPTPALGTIGTLLKDEEFENLFMKMIKNKFVDNRNRQHQMSTYTQYTTVSSSNGVVEDRNNVVDRSYRSFDLLSECATYMVNPEPFGGDFVFLTDDALERKIVHDSAGIYRHIKKTRMMKLFSKTVDHLNTSYSKKSLLESQSWFSSLSGLLDSTLFDQDDEVIGYRIEKIGGTPTGDSRTLSVLSNFYIFNDDLPTSTEDDKFHFYDTQLKYGHQYQYNIYEYRAVGGYKYRYSDVELTRQIGTTGTDSDGDGVDDTYCLEFHAPNNSAASLYDRPENGQGTYIPLSGAAADQNPYATSAQVLSSNGYLCMFNYTIEPFIDIIEVPLSSKNLSILDHPPRAVEIIPYQRKDDSQTIGFYAKYESFVPQPYPETIGPTEEVFKNTYLESNNLLETEDISEESTKPTAVQVFRINTKPTSYNDFANNLVITKPLRDSTFEFPFTDCFYEERIQTNQKYYYLFRFINQHSMPGYVSPVVEVELVSDGGYKYTLFDILESSEITDDIAVDAPSKPFKKLLQLLPSPAQVMLDDSAVDYAEDAADQIGNMVVGNADEKIWDKTFKVRLTSKKNRRKTRY